MNVFIIGIARENGQLLASPYFEKELRLLGIRPGVAAVHDQEELEGAFRQVVLQGGLLLCPLSGQAQLDRLLSRQVAKACGLEQVLHQKAFEQLAARNASLTREEVVALATLPQGAQVYAYGEGTVPAYQVEGENINAILLPADPAEQCSVLLHTIFPTLSQQPKYPCSSHELRVLGMDQQKLEKALAPVLSSENPCIALYPGREEWIVRVSARAQEAAQAAAASSEAAQAVAQHLDGAVYGIDVPNIERALLQRLEAQKLGLSLAESGSNRLGEKRLVKAQKGEAVALSFPQERNVPAVEDCAQRYGAVSAQSASALAAASSGAKTIGVGITVPTAKEKAASAFVAASFSGTTLCEELPLRRYHSVSQLQEACVTRALGLAHQYARAYPSLPEGTSSVPQALQGAFGAAAAAAKGDKPAKDSKSAKSSGGKKSGGKGILGALFPQKGDSAGEKARKIGIWICLFVFCGSMAYLLNHHQRGVKAGQESEKLQEMLQQAEQGQLEVAPELLEKVAPEVLEKYKPFKAINEDMVGWVQLADTNLNYPVVQTVDNDFYHRTGFTGEYDFYGVPYVDFECTVDAEENSDNLIVYGHNIGNDGLMFNPLTYYKQLDFYKKHPTVRFDTIYKEQEYKIFGVFICNAQPEQDNGTVFRYNTYIDMDDDTFNAYVKEVRRRSMWNNDVDVQPGDKLLTLSTCTYDFKPEARIVVVARALREGEDPNEGVSTAVQNPSAYYPKAYYDAVNERAKYGHVKGIRIDGAKEYTLEVGQTLQLKAITDPADAPINTANWDSNAKAVATVDPKTGLVTAIAPGEASITANADDGGYAAMVKITVKAKNALKYLYFDEDELNLSVGQEARLKVYVEPEDAAATLEWSCNSDALATTVNKSNQKELVIKGLSPTGESPAIITVKDTVTGIYATCAVNVNDATPQASIPPALSLAADTPGQLTVSITPASAAAQLEYDADDNLTVSGPSIQGGKAIYTISISGQPGDRGEIQFGIGRQYLGSCIVTVAQSSQQPQQPQQPAAPDTPAIYLPGGVKADTANLTPIQVTLGTVNGEQPLTLVDANGNPVDSSLYEWESNNENVVDAYKGKLYFDSQNGEAGMATITVKNKQSGAVTQFVINVVAPEQPKPDEPKPEEPKPEQPDPEQPTQPEEPDPNEPSEGEGEGEGGETEGNGGGEETPPANGGEETPSTPAQEGGEPAAQSDEAEEPAPAAE